MRRIVFILLIVIAVIAVALVGLRLGQVSIAKIVMSRIAAQNAGVDRAAALPDGLHVFICGAGSPMPDPLRAGPCTGIVAGDQVFVVDTGSGSLSNLLRMGFPVGRVEAAVLTHLHSDHIDGLGEFLMQSWINGLRTAPTPVWGPDGVSEVVSGFNAAYRIDSTYRQAHHGDDVANLTGFGGTPHRLEATLAPVVIYDAGGLKVSSISVSHHPADPTLGLRFDYKGRSVTISGDTIYNRGLVDMAQGTDLLLHDALNTEMVEIIRDPLYERGQAHLDKVLYDIQNYHARPVDAARAAREAGAGALVLHHIVPPLPSRQLYPLFLQGTKSIYSGKITVAEDGQIISLPSGSDDIKYSNGFGF